MQTFTDEVARLCGEIRALHRERESFLKDLAHETKDRAGAVSEMRAGFSQARTEMAHKLRGDLLAFTTKLKREVGGQGRQFRADMTGARRAWCGKKTFWAAG